MKSGEEKGAKYTDIKIKTSYKAKIRKLYTFSLTEAFESCWIDMHLPSPMLGKSAKDLAENIWNTVCQRVRALETEAQGKSRHKREISAKPPYRKNTAYTCPRALFGILLTSFLHL